MEVGGDHCRLPTPLPTQATPTQPLSTGETLDYADPASLGGHVRVVCARVPTSVSTFAEIFARKFFWGIFCGANLGGDFAGGFLLGGLVRSRLTHRALLGRQRYRLVISVTPTARSEPLEP